ncbi:hypothetical protein [Halomicrobium urmianum]|uniref:hypothetical protein n=1 Tax=Halomicrobium urmianum TaxID=1586233 RepID=UPI001CD944C4|nr:hypothetical protein [Halomicrobium urmianum]
MSTHTRVPSLARCYRVVALVATLVCAGVGHVLVGRWKRGLAWFALYVGSLMLLSSYALVDATVGEPFLLEALERSLAPSDVLFPLSVIVLCLFDLYAVGPLPQADPRTSETGQ